MRHLACFFLPFLCGAALAQDAPPARRSPLTHILLPRLDHTNEPTLDTVGEIASGQQLYYWDSSMRVALKVKGLERQSWTTAKPARARQLRREILQRLRRRGYSIRSAHYRCDDEDFAGFTATRTSQHIAALWFERDHNFILYWGEQVPQTPQRRLEDELLAAVSTGAVEATARLLQRGINPNAKTYNGTPALQLAGKVEQLRLLLDAGADVNGRGRDGGTALGDAARGGDEVLAQCLLERGADPNLADNCGYTPLMRASWAGQISYRPPEYQQWPGMVRLLLKHGADVKPRNGYPRYSALMLAAQQDHGVVAILVAAGADPNESYGNFTVFMRLLPEANADTIKVMLEHGADTKFCTAENETALILAASNAEAVRLLVDKGIDVNARTRDGRTALMTAAQNAAEKSVQLLMSHGADLQAVDNRGRKALFYLAEAPWATNLVEIMKMLVAGGTAIDSRDHDGNTMLMLVATHNNPQAIGWLLQNGADLAARDRAGHTAFMHAAATGSPATLAALMEAGATIDTPSGMGETALMVAAANRNFDTAEWLLKNGAAVNQRTPAGNTALMKLAGRNHDSPINWDVDEVDVARLLLAHGANVNVSNSAGETALSIALAHQRWKLARYLKHAGAR